jgi:hypothetical protein
MSASEFVKQLLEFVQCCVLNTNTNAEIATGQSKWPEIKVILLKNTTKYGLEIKMARINC